MIKSYRHQGLKELFETGNSRRVPANFVKRIARMLEVLDEAENLHDLAIPSYAIHPLRGLVPPRYSMSVNGPWRITFQFENGEVRLVDLEQYH